YSDVVWDNTAMLATEAQIAALIELFHTGSRQEFTKGEFIVRPGQTLPGVYYIESGLVKAYDITKYGEENLLIIRHGGELLGMTWALAGREREIIYTALAPTAVWLISLDTFKNHMHTNPEAAVPVISILADMFRLHGERIMTLEYRTVRERLASFLLGMAERFGVDSDIGLKIDVPLRHQDIASSISATRETTSRTLSELERKGIIRNEQSHIIILNRDALSDFIE
ncbi:Crp/Fnr family transcriptional regulator, partial [Candidatus Saccharibacteria bacterium]|nr:Crp/Fnr family transcriptional regulator [Candidatus Saccharibacteria bacterium]